MDQIYHNFTMEQSSVLLTMRLGGWRPGFVAVRTVHRFELAVLIDDQMWVTGEEAVLQLRNGGQGDMPAEQHLLQAISLCRERYRRLAEDAR